jgi:hypothetical protein
LLTDGIDNWTYNTQMVKWSTGLNYTVTARAHDMIDNIEQPMNNIEFVFDTTLPMSFVVYPDKGLFVNELDTIFGNATDLSGSGIDKVEITIMRTGSKQYWTYDGDTWTADRQWLLTSGTVNWSFDASEIEWMSDNYYEIYSHAIDRAGNYEVYGESNTFMFDNEPPELLFSINHGAKYTSNSTVELNLESYDSGSGIDRIAFSFDNTTWQPPGEFLETQVLTLPPADGEKTVYARITDKANNTCSPFAKKIVLDTEPPECSVMINDNATYTNSKDISLNITGLDMLSGVSEMSFSVDMEEWSPWQLFDFTKTYILSGDDGIKIVYLRVRDGAGNIAVAWDTIVLDTTPPHSLMISANNGAPETKSTEVISHIYIHLRLGKNSTKQ